MASDEIDYAKANIYRSYVRARRLRGYRAPWMSNSQYEFSQSMVEKRIANLEAEFPDFKEEFNRGYPRGR